jgi:ribosome-associated heat shock protein Hsp15
MAPLPLDSVRIDKFLWAMRLYKTRSDAAQACEKNHVLINQREAKASNLIRVGDILAIKRPPVYFSYRIVALIMNRQSAKNVNQYIEDITPESEKEKLKFQKMVAPLQRPKGSGRPTKKDRRELDDFTFC